MVQYRKGHKNSKGESAPWVIVSCGDGKTEKGTVLSSHKSKSAADDHLQQMHAHSANESVDFKAWLGEQPQTPMMEAVTQIYDALFENSNGGLSQHALDAWWNDDDVVTKSVDPAEAKAYEAAKSLFVPANGQESKMISQIKEMWDNELSSCGFDITNVEDYDPADGRLPEISISFTDLNENNGTLVVRSDDKGRLSYIIRDEKGKNMNPYLYQFTGNDISQFEDRYECSPKYAVNAINDLLDEISSYIPLYGTSKHYLLRNR